MQHAENPAPFPTGWPRARYRTVRRAMKTLLLADHLLRSGLACTAADATDELIRTAAQQGEHSRPPSDTTCSLVRAVLTLLLSPAADPGPPRERPTAPTGGHPPA